MTDPVNQAGASGFRNDVIQAGAINAVVRGKHGYFVYNKHDIYIGRSMGKYGEFSELEVALFRQILGPNDIVVEVGANIGSHTVAISSLIRPHGKVLAFEPQRIVFQTLCANLALNSILNVECFQKAVGSVAGHVLIPEFDYGRPGNYGGVALGEFETGNKVPQISLDGFLDVPRLKLLKIDVEGMERQVIEGAKATIAQHRPTLYVENDRVERSQALIQSIMSLDYKLYWHLPPLYNPNNFAGDGENVFDNIGSWNMFCVPSERHVQLTGFDEITDPSVHPLAKMEEQNDK
jgi:FkbM family methyltransferase